MSYVQRRRFLWILFFVGPRLIAMTRTPRRSRALRFQTGACIPQPSRGCAAPAPTRGSRMAKSGRTRVFVVSSETRVFAGTIVVRQPGGNFNTCFRTWRARRNFAPERKSTCF